MSKQDPENPIHQPEFIILEAEELPRSEEQSDIFETLKKVNAKHFPWGIRIIILTVFLFFFPILAILLLYVLIQAAVALVTFFQSPAAISNLQKAWTTFTNGIVMTLGLGIAIFSPAFGFSVIMLYFLLHRDNSGGVYVRRFFKSRFK